MASRSRMYSGRCRKPRRCICSGAQTFILSLNSLSCVGVSPDGQKANDKPRDREGKKRVSQTTRAISQHFGYSLLYHYIPNLHRVSTLMERGKKGETNTLKKARTRTTNEATVAVPCVFSNHCHCCCHGLSHLLLPSSSPQPTLQQRSSLATARSRT